MIADTVQLFRVAADEKRDGVSPPERDHELHALMERAVRDLYSNGQPGRDAFKALLRDSSPHVRGWVAAQLLYEGDRDAKPILAELAKGPGLGGLSARMVLEQHADGKLKSPFGIRRRRLTRR